MLAVVMVGAGGRGATTHTALLRKKMFDTTLLPNLPVRQHHNTLEKHLKALVYLAWPMAYQKLNSLSNYGSLDNLET